MNFIIGTREIVKKIEKGLIEKVVIAENIPEKLKEKIETAAKKYNVKIETDGNERQVSIFSFNFSGIFSGKVKRKN